VLAPLPCHCAVIRQAARAVSGFYDRRLRPAGLVTTQYTMLQRIRKTPGIRTGDISAEIALDQTATTRSLATLARVGLIRFTPGTDRREKHWFLTPKGGERLKAAARLWAEAQAEFEARVGSSAAETFRDLGFRITESLRA